MGDPARLPPRRREDFQIAIICALKVEFDAVEALFDQYWDDNDFGKSKGDPNAYSNGRIGQHDVVLTYMPGIGKVRSASVAAALCVSYTNICLGLVVGICGGALQTPNGDNIFLGDVIISTKALQFDLGRQFHGSFRVKDSLEDSLARPSHAVSSFLKKISSMKTAEKLKQQVSKCLSDILTRTGFEDSRYPGIKEDRLYEPNYLHKHHQPLQCEICEQSDVEQDSFCEETLKATCDELGCSDEMLLHRDSGGGPPDRTVFPKLHQGIFASGDQVIRSAPYRDSLSKQHGVIGFEMEGAGTWDNFPTLIVKSVCDYADSHKNKKWQRYAAASAAATAKALLAEWVAADVESPTVNEFDIQFNPNDVPLTNDFVSREAELSQIGQALIPDHGKQQKTRKLFSLYGLGGIGKTQLAAKFAQANAQHFSAVIWLDGSSLDSVKSSFSRFSPRIQSTKKEKPQEASKQEEAVETVLAWLAQPRNTNWLMIFDNVDLDVDAKPPDLQAYDIRNFLPPADHGSVLITSRLESMQRLGDSARTPRLSLAQSKQLVEKRIGYPLTDEKVAEVVIERLDGHALALTMAASYISETGMSFEEYNQHYTEAWSELVEQQDEYPHQEYGKRPMLATWQLSYNQIESQSSDAAQLLKTCAFLYKTGLDYDMFQPVLELEAPETLDAAWLVRICKSRLSFAKPVRLLRRYSLIEEAETKDMFSIHSVLHEWVRHLVRTGPDSENSAMYRLAGNLIGRQKRKVDNTSNFWPMYRRLAPHASSWIQQSQLMEMRPGIPPQEIVSVALVLELCEDLAGAETAYLQALEARKHHVCQSASYSPFLFEQLGLVYRQQDRLVEAEQMISRALDDFKRLPDATGERMYSAMCSLGKVYQDQGKYEDAERLFEKILEETKDMLSPDSGVVVTAHKGLSSAYYRLDRLDDAEKMLKKVLEAHRNEDWSNDYSILETILNLGSIYLGKGRLDEAEELYLRARKGQERLIGPDHSDTLNCVLNLGNLYHDQGKLEAAEQMYVEALEGYEKVFGPYHATTLGTIANTANLYIDMGKLEEAESMYMRALRDGAKAHGAIHVQILKIVGKLGRLYYDQGRMAESERHLARALCGLNKAMGPTHSFTLYLTFLTGNAYAAQGKFEMAEQTFLEQLRGEEEMHCPDRIQATWIVDKLGWFYLNRGRLADAEQQFKRALKGYESGHESGYGPDHEQTKAIKAILESIQKRIGDTSSGQTGESSTLTQELTSLAPAT